ncbi:hypothetical protein ACQYAD_04520 [Neobacillus sp. SM06]|uniref:hypothetical protein n=1 Tax=Neobacillus sp. SM06 TaxID=3422492 RepID=UPI003D268332
MKSTTDKRGGISLGGSYNVVQHNTIRDNGKGSNSFLDGKPFFSDPTRYAINQEDSYGDNCIIRNNLIYGSNHGILVGCYSIQIENNHIYNIDSIAINLYSLLYANIRGNVMNNCPTTIGFMTTDFRNALVNILENSFQGGKFSVDATDSYQVNVANNHFVDVDSIYLGSSTINKSFYSNRIKYDQVSGTPSISAYKIENCIFDSTTVRDFLIRVYNQKGCTFHNLRISLQTQNGATKREKILIYDCEYTNSTLINLIFGTKDREVSISNSKFTDTVVKVGNINTVGFPATTTLENCELYSATMSYLFATDFNQPSGMIKLSHCRIEIANSSFAHLIHHDKTAGISSVFTLFLKDSSLKYTGTAPLDFIYYNNINPMIQLISANNEYINIHLPVEDPGIFVGYDPTNTYKTSVILQQTSDGYSATITHNLKTLDPYVLCTTLKSEMVQPLISIVDENSLLIKTIGSSILKVTIKKV